MKAKAIISNTFILHLKPGEKIIKEMGGIGNFMHYHGINVTDSGGFQMYSPSCYISSTDQGVWFRNPFTKQKIFITPEKDMEIQLDLGSEIAMCLDSMPLIKESRQKVAEAVRKTTLWAIKCRTHHNALQKNTKKKQLLFGISQGGVYTDLRKKSAKALLQVGFDGYSIGGLALGETKAQEYKAIEVHKSVIPKNKVTYLMGAGHPVEILEAVSRGVDMFDSRFPTMNARRGTIFTSKGKLHIYNSQYKTDKSPLDENCSCFVCSHYSRAYLRHGLKSEDANTRRLASYHNLYYMMQLLQTTREMIKKGKFLEFLKSVKKVYTEDGN
jgi:queuine tRNA-ribosyltransferase